MRFPQFVAVLGVAAGAGLGATLAAGATAGASPIDDAWPYGDFQLPGVGTGNIEGLGFGLVNGVEHYSFPFSDETYSATYSGIREPFFGYLIHQKVFDGPGPAAPDASIYIPPNRTTDDTLSLPLLINTLIVDPHAGIGDQFELPNFLANTFISDSAGTQDVLSISGQDYTLFDFPAASGPDSLLDWY